MFDAKRLEILLRVVESGSVTAAADELFYTPSAVSQQLRKLEEEVGQPLLQRRAKGMVPTDAGLVLAGHARSILRQMDAASADLDQIRGLKRGSLSIGTFPTLGGSFLPIVVSRFRKENPGIRLDVRSDRLNGLVSLLASGEVGLCFMWEYDWHRLDPAAFHITTVFEEPTVLMVGKEHPLASTPHPSPITMSSLASEEWIVRANEHPVAEVLERSCNAAGFSPRISFKANDYQEAQAMVSVGLGIAMAPQSATVNLHPGVEVIPLETAVPSRRVVLAQRHDRVHAPAEVAFQSLTLQLGTSWLSTMNS